MFLGVFRDQKRMLVTIGLMWSVTLCVVCFRAIAADDFQTQEDRKPLHFQKQVKAILTAHCWKCHGLESRKADLDLRSVALMLKGGNSGPAVIKGVAQKSLIYRRILDGSMPPEGELPLTKVQIDNVRYWIDSGAATNAVGRASDSERSLVSDEDRKFWSFTRPAAINSPEPLARDRKRTTVDAFLLRELDKQSLSFSADADRRTIINRLYLDLIGLPPTPESIDAFVDDGATDAYENLVDRLLGSHHFGERWGRHWLDVVGYTDTIGDDTDATITKLGKGKWRYRDYVIGAFNSDKPYDRFLIEQFAGDELFDWRTQDTFTQDQRNLLIATGFLRTAPDETLQTELNTADIRHAVLERTLETSLGSVLGLTVGCARCHSHKYDPIPHEDYYRLLSVFTPAYNPQSWLQPAAREIPDVSPVHKLRIESHNESITQRISQFKMQLEAMRKPVRERLLVAKLAMVPEGVREKCKMALATAPEKRNARQKQLLMLHDDKLKVSLEEVRASQAPKVREADVELEKKTRELDSERRSWGMIQAVYDVESPPPTYLLRRGNHETPGHEVTPGILQVLAASESQAGLEAVPPYSGASGRRLALVKRLVNPDSVAGVLVARVFVNRVWQQLFGRGIVATSDNFGASGARPTHPELLDWLAMEFIGDQWQVKPLVRLLVTSTAYRQESNYGNVNQRVAVEEDPDNLLLWRMPLRRLESEIVRDRILATSGLLDRSVGGPPVMHAPTEDGTVHIKQDLLATPSSKWRRSVYVLSRHRYHLSILDVFDQPEVTGPCLQRKQAPAVSQSLMLLNNPFLYHQAEVFSRRVQSETKRGSRRDRIQRAFLLALGRPPDSKEMTWSEELITKQEQRYLKSSPANQERDKLALNHLCHVLLNCSEFLYVP